MRKIGSVLSIYYDMFNSTQCFTSVSPMTFEQINFPYGYVLYSTIIQRGTIIEGSNIRDFGYVFVDGIYQGVISPNYMPSPRSRLQLGRSAYGSNLVIIVENRGRQTYQTINDVKGIVGDIFLDGVALKNWTQCGIDLDSLQTYWRQLSDNDNTSFRPGDVFVGEFVATELEDTYLDPSVWGKGVAFINGFNIGRYWPTAGPQITLYVPKPLLNTTNTVMLIEFESAPVKCIANPRNCTVHFVDTPVYRARQSNIIF